MGYKNALFCFMSGTGNSYRVASWLQEAAKEDGSSSAVLSIDRGCKPEGSIVTGENSLVGLIMPTHGFTAPWPMVRFALSLPQGRGTHTIVIPTRAGTKIGPMFFPGFQGTAGYLLAIILVLKGYRVRGVIGIDMPSNWTALHWGLSPANSRAIIARAKQKTAMFISRILAGRQSFGYGGIVELLLGLLVAPVSVGYLLYGRIQLAKLFFASDECNGCGLCADHCPVSALKMIGGKPYWTYRCESCMRCMNFCPTKAVEASQPLLAAFVLAAGVPVVDYVLNRMDDYFPAFIKNGFVMFLIQYFYFFTSVCLVYLIFAALNRIPVVSRVFKYLTLTHYYRRYHEPDTRVSELAGRKK